MDKLGCDEILLSGYVEVIAYEDTFILFNKLNGCIVQLEKKYVLHKDGKVFLRQLENDNMKFLSENDYFVDDKTIQSFIQNTLSHPTLSTETNLIFSVTEKCNLSCSYCYQHKWNKCTSLSNSEYLSLGEAYIRSIIPRIQQKSGELNINFIGGEPLLNAELVTELMKMVERVNASRIQVNYHIDTNITLITREFITQFPNLMVNTTLTPENDHNALRSNSYKAVMDKLFEIKDIFDDIKYKIVIRYNVNHENINGISHTISELKKLNFPWYFDVQNILNSPDAPYTNKLTEEEFEEVYLNQILPVLIANNVAPNILPAYGLSRQCKASSILDRKIFSNGQIVLCDAFPKSEQGATIAPLPTLPSKCIKCLDFPYCGGPKPCDTVECNGTYAKKNNAISRIKAYMKYVAHN